MCIRDRLNTTTIYVTHDQIEAMTMADEIVVMRHGVIEQIGSPEAIYDRPVNTFVADFIGAPAINFMHGTVVEGKSNFLLVGDQNIELNTDCTATAGTQVSIGIRPLDFQIDASGPYSGTAEFVENTGAETHIHMMFAGQRIRAVSPTRLPCKKGDEVTFTIDKTKIHLFDSNTEARIN